MPYMSMGPDHEVLAGWLPKIYGDFTHTLLRMVLPGFVAFGVFFDRLLEWNISLWLIVAGGIITGLVLYAIHEVLIRSNPPESTKFSFHALASRVFVPDAQAHFQAQRKMLIDLFPQSPTTDKLKDLPPYIQNEIWKVWQHRDPPDPKLNALKKALTHNAHFLGSIRWFCMYSSSAVILALPIRFLLLGVNFSDGFSYDPRLTLFFLVLYLVLQQLARIATKSMEEIDGTEAKRCMTKEEFEELFRQ